MKTNSPGGSKLTRSVIEQSTRKVLRDWMHAGRVGSAHDVSRALSDQFTMDVLERLGRPKEVLAIECSDLTGPPGASQRNEIFYDGRLTELGVKLPLGVTTDSLNASGLGVFGTWIFLRWESPAGPVYFDAEVPQGVDSPFSLPEAQRHLTPANLARNYAINLVRPSAQPKGKAVIEVPAGWTKEQDLAGFKRFTEASGLRGELYLVRGADIAMSGDSTVNKALGGSKYVLKSEDPIGLTGDSGSGIGHEFKGESGLQFQAENYHFRAADRICLERHDLANRLEGLLDDFCPPEEKAGGVLNVAKSHLDPSAKADLAGSFIQTRLQDASLSARVQIVFSSVSSAFELGSDALSRYALSGYVPEGRRPWLIEMAAAINNFNRAGWRLTCLIRTLRQQHSKQFGPFNRGLAGRFYPPHESAFDWLGRPDAVGGHGN